MLVLVAALSVHELIGAYFAGETLPGASRLVGDM